MSQKYKKLQKGKSKTGVIIVIGILLIIIVAIFCYFKFIYENPESIKLRKDITELKEEFDKTKSEWENFPVAVNELKALENDLNLIITYKEQKMNSSTVTEIRKKYSELRYKLNQLILDLPKVKNVPEGLKKLKAEIELYREIIKKPGKKEKELLNFAKEKYLELENKSKTAETISDLELIFVGIQEIKTKLVIFQTFLQIKKAEWKEQITIANDNFNFLKKLQENKSVKMNRKCYYEIDKIMVNLEATQIKVKKIKTQGFNLKNLTTLKSLNKKIDNLFTKFNRTIEHINKTNIQPTNPDCPKKPPPPPRPDCVIVKPAVIKKTYTPEVPKSKIPGGQSSIVVIVNIVIKADGTPSTPELESSTGSDFLDETAKDAALKFEFEPAYCEDGRAAETTTQIPLQIKGK